MHNLPELISDRVRRRPRTYSLLIPVVLLVALLLLLRDTSPKQGVTHAAGLASVPTQADKADKYGQRGKSQEAPQSTQPGADTNPQLPSGGCGGTLINEGFDNITTLPGNGWFTQNNSTPVGSTGWFQGNSNVFVSHSGVITSYIGANFNNTSGTNTISNWLLTPQIPLQNGNTLVFWTRVPTDSPFPDRLEIRLSTAGASTNVGTGSSAVGDFTTVLLSINPNLEVDGYPDTWTQYIVTLSGLSGTQSGRIAFRYYVTMGGPTGDNSNYIGIDTVTYTATCTPTATPTSCPVQFNDVPSSGPGSTFYSYVRCLACRNIVTGYPCGAVGEPCPGTYFRPGLNVTRGQISKMVAIAAGLSGPAGTRKFQDVPEDSPFYLWIQQLANGGAISGYACGGTNPATGAAEPCVAPGNLHYFRPNNSLTRGQLAKIVSEVAGFSDAAGAQLFADVPPASPFFIWVQRLANRGIVSGYPCGSTNPATGAPEPCDGAARPYYRVNNNVTRGQVAKIVAETFYPGCQTPARSIR